MGKLKNYKYVIMTKIFVILKNKKVFNSMSPHRFISHKRERKELDCIT